ncbi:hypothetical protein Tco_0615198 [Tanacetum coccineum]
MSCDVWGLATKDLIVVRFGYLLFRGNQKKADGLIELICFLIGDFENELVLPFKVWPFSCLYDQNYVDLVDAKGVVHMVKMNRDLDPCVWIFNRDKWIEFMSSFKDLDPEIMHFDLIDPYSPLDVVEYKAFSELRLVGVAFTGPKWERVCESGMFSASKVIVISSDEYGGSFVGKVIHGFVSDSDVVPMNIFGPGESSNMAAVFEKSFIIEFSSCADTKGYLDVLELNVGDRIRFRLVFGNLTSDEPLFFDVCKVV